MTCLDDVLRMGLCTSDINVTINHDDMVQESTVAASPYREVPPPDLGLRCAPAVGKLGDKNGGVDAPVLMSIPCFLLHAFRQHYWVLELPPSAAFPWQ